MPATKYFANAQIAEVVDLAKGKLYGASHINKFGYNSAVGTSYENCTDLGSNQYYPSAAGVVSIISASANDTSAGTGARTVEIQGLDADYNLLVETVTMNGTVAVTTTGSFLRVFRMRVITAGTGLVNDGNITASISSTDIARISANEGQTLMAIYTVPAKKRAYLIKVQGSLSKNQEANFQLRSRQVGGGWNVKGLWGTFSASINYDYPIPLEFTQKTDIEVRVKAGATSEMGVIFDLILVDD